MRKLHRIAGLMLLALVVLAAYGAFRPAIVPFSYSGKNCHVQPLWLPELLTYQSNDSMAATPVNMVSFLGYSLYSHHTCLTMRKATVTTQKTQLKLQLRSIGLPVKDLNIHYDSLPALVNQAGLSGPVATSGNLRFDLDKADSTFDYRLSAAGRSTACTRSDRQLHCDVEPLQLAQASRYSFDLQRHYRNQNVGSIYRAELATVQTVAVASSTIANSQTVYDKPNELTLTMNRPAATLNAISLKATAGNVQQDIAHSTEFEGDKLRIRFAQPLPRNSDISLRIGRITASDGGFLAAPYELRFKTSGGPKAKSISIGSYDVSPRATMRLAFDSPIKTAQPLENFVQIEVGGKQVPATLASTGNTISIAPRQPFGSCVTFTVRVLDGLLSAYDVSGGSQWQFQSRTTCQVTFSIGTSVQGRPITAYKFGSGGSRIVYVGGTHGNERSSASLLQRWVDYLEANPGLVQAGRAVTIIPILNPDGYAANGRTNARNVDLNRNFPSNNWKKSVTMPDKSVNANGGGSSPLSEPESAALAGYINSQNPRLVLTYHATGGVVIPNDAGDSASLARNYADRSSVYFAANAATATLFEYDTTGALEDWLHDKRGTPALLIELETMSGYEFNGHVGAMRSTTNL